MASPINSGAENSRKNECVCGGFAYAYVGVCDVAPKSLSIDPLFLSFVYAVFFFLNGLLECALLECAWNGGSDCVFFFGQQPL